MAIVKFVSDKDYQIFIDKECVGEVNKDSVLKLTLESGGYLVEVKDRDKRIQKKYILEIPPTANQVLQDVSEKTITIGYGDVLPLSDETTLYDEIVYSGSRNIVKRDGKYGIVDVENKVILPIEFEEIAMLGDEYFKLKVNNGWALGFFYHGIIYPGTYDQISLFS